MEKVINKIGKTAARTYQYAAKTAGKIAREIKLKSQMADDKDQIKSLYEEIGKSVYEKYLSNEEIDVEADIRTSCSMIDVLSDEIEQLREEILDLKDLKQCKNCYYEIESDFHYCPNCGCEQNLSEENMKNDGPATIETTDEEDSILKKQEE